MDFYLKLNKQVLLTSLPVVRNRQVPASMPLAESSLFFIGEDGHTTLDAIPLRRGKAWVMGDPVYHAQDKKEAHEYLERGEYGRFFRSVDGFYFLLCWDRETRQIVAGSSMFNILPVFYTEMGSHLLISSSFDLLRDTEGIDLSADRQYYLEKALFYYPLFTRTPLEQVKTIPSNHILAYDGRLSFSRHTDISDYYTHSPLPWRDSVDNLAEIFIEQAKAFIPGEGFCATLTGGFDGRTVVSLALNLNRPFYTYSYGGDSSPDLNLPRAISQKMGFAHRPLILNEKYSENHYWENGLTFLSGSYGLGNMSRAHYHYAIQTVLQDSRFLLSGNFGSEMIRSMKVPGVMASKILFELFEKPDLYRLSNLIEGWPGLKYLSKALVEEHTEQLLDEICSYLQKLPSHLPTNKKFCIYLFEEVFPKYFGPEITVQRRFLNHRAPFLCFRFIEELLKTGIAGANSLFRETNPFKRYHGQALYAHILKRTSPSLLDFPLDKGYKPRHFLTVAGPLQIAAGFAWRKLRWNKAVQIPDYSKDNIARNLEKFRQASLPSCLFNARHFELQFAGHWLDDQINFANMVSAAQYHNFVHQPVRHTA